MNFKKAEMGVETFFYILMAVIFVWILIFGFQKIFSVQDQLSEQERIEFKKDFEELISYCEDPLNRGNLKNVRFKTKNYNSICILGEDIYTKDGFRDIDDFIILYEAGDNVVLAKLETQGQNINYTKEPYIYDKISLDFSVPETFCKVDYNGTGYLYFEIKCS